MYQCVKCGRRFVAGHFAEVRVATGRTVECCGEPARWLGDLDEWEAKELDDLYAMREAARRSK